MITIVSQLIVLLKNTRSYFLWHFLSVLSELSEGYFGESNINRVFIVYVYLTMVSVTDCWWFGTVLLNLSAISKLNTYIETWILLIIELLKISNLTKFCPVLATLRRSPVLRVSSSGQLSYDKTLGLTTFRLRALSSYIKKSEILTQVANGSQDVHLWGWL